MKKEYISCGTCGVRLEAVVENFVKNVNTIRGFGKTCRACTYERKNKRYAAKKKSERRVDSKGFYNWLGSGNDLYC